MNALEEASEHKKVVKKVKKVKKVVKKPIEVREEKEEETKEIVEEAKIEELPEKEVEELEEGEEEIIEIEEGEGEEELIEGEEEELGVEIEEEAVEEIYVPHQKPELSLEVKRQLRHRDEIRRRRPKFRRQDWFRYKRLGEQWRKPRGRHSKQRKHKKYRPNVVSIGYRSPALVRGLHPSGFEEIRISNPKELEQLDPKRQAARIAHSVGTKKREKILERADELGIRVLNP